MQPSSMPTLLTRPGVASKNPDDEKEVYFGADLVDDLVPGSVKKGVGPTAVTLMKKAALAVEESGKSILHGADREQRGVDKAKERERKETHRKEEMSHSQRAGVVSEQVLDLSYEQAQMESNKQRMAQDYRQVDRTMEAQKGEMAKRQEWSEHDIEKKRFEAEARLKDKVETERIQAEATVKHKVETARTERFQLEETERQNMAIQKAELVFNFEKLRHAKYLELLKAKQTELLEGPEFQGFVAGQVETVLDPILHKKEYTSVQEMERRKAEVLSQFSAVKIESEIAAKKSELSKESFVAAAATQAAEQELLLLARMEQHRQRVAEMEATETMEEDVEQKAHNDSMKKRLGERRSAVQAEAAHRDTQSQIEATQMISGLTCCSENVKAQSSIVGKRKELENEIESALGINKEGDMKIEAVRKKLQIAKVLFLLVILGCELDLFGFGLAFTTYWVAGQKIVFNETLHQDVTIQTQPLESKVIHILLWIGPTGYLLATMMYILWTYGFVTWVVTNILGDSPYSQDLREKLIVKDSSMRAQIRLEEGADNKPLEYNEFQLELCKEEVYLKFYHFLPLFRYYLLVKDPECADVESLFRVNGLSTFTLGFVQMACMTIGITTGMLTIDFSITFGMFAQVVNLFMTGVYFFTSFPEIMKSAMSVEAFQYNSRLAMQGEFTRYKLVSEQYSLNFGDVVPTMDLFEFLSEVPGARTAEAAPRTHPQISEKQKQLLKELNHFRFRAMRDINELSHLHLNLAPFSTQQLFEWRAKLASHQVVRYGKLAGI